MRIAKALVYIATAITVGILFFIVAYILYRGVPHLKPSLFAFKYNSTNVSMFPSIVNTILITILSLGVTLPLGIFTAIYLTEYAKKESKFVQVIRLTVETLAGIPSIVYGLFGMLFFVSALKFGYSIVSGALTLSIMILPIVMRTSEEAILAVPISYREGSYGLGAGKLRTINKIVMPSASHGILAGVILGIGRIVGETAALIYTAGTVPELPRNILSSGRTLSVHMYTLSGEGLNINEASATAVVLLVTVIIINTVASVTARSLSKRNSA